jgi:hypothetical protein
MNEITGIFISPATQSVTDKGGYTIPELIQPDEPLTSHDYNVPLRDLPTLLSGLDRHDPRRVLVSEHESYILVKVFK